MLSAPNGSALVLTSAAVITPPTSIAMRLAKGKALKVASSEPVASLAQIAEALSLPLEALSPPLTDIRVITPPLGGGFGAKLEPSVEMYAAVLARKARDGSRSKNHTGPRRRRGDPAAPGRAPGPPNRPWRVTEPGGSLRWPVSYVLRPCCSPPGPGCWWAGGAHQSPPSCYAPRGLPRRIGCGHNTSETEAQRAIAV